MGSLKRRSLSGLVRLSEDAPNAGGTNQYPPGGQVSVSDGPALAVAEGVVPQYEFPTSSPDALVTDTVTDPGVVSEEIGRQSAPRGTEPIVPVPAATPRGTEPIASLPVAMPSTRLSPSPTAALRKPLVIHAKPRGLPPKAASISPRKRRVLVYATVVTLLVAILLGTLGSAVAAKDNNGGIGHLVSPLVQLFGARNGDAMNVNSQALTPTPTPTPTPIIATTNADAASLSPANSNTSTSAGSAGALDGVYNPSRFAYGYCTYWAFIRYHELTGHTIDWQGDAYEWAAGAANAGWTVSNTPHVYSVVVMQPYVNGTGALGHVAVVEKINPDGSFLTTNENWTKWGVEQDVTFTTGPGISFLWYPGT